METEINQAPQKHYFEINHFKRIKITFNIPEFIPVTDIFGIRMKILDKEKKTIFSETYPLSHILI
jgi:hypothetical protein